MKTSLFPYLTAGALLLPVASFGQPSAVTSTAIGSADTAQIQPLDESQLTAKDLIGQHVIGRDGERVGYVSDVVLGASLEDRFSRPGRSPSIAIAPTQAADSRIQLVVTIGGLLGGVVPVRTSEVTVPLERFEYDHANDRFMLDVPEDELAAIAEGQAPAATTADASRGQGTIGGSEDAPAGTIGTTGTIGANDRTARDAAGETWGSGTTATETRAADRGVVGATRDDNGENRDNREFPTAEVNDRRTPTRLGADGPGRELEQIASALEREMDDELNLSRITLSFAGDAVVIGGTVENQEQLQRITEIARAQTDIEVRNWAEVEQPFAAE